MTSRWFNPVAVFLLASGLACSDDSTTPTPPQDSAKNLTQKSHVLDNIELAYNNRRVDLYDGLLDDNFTFFYTEPDGGAGTPVQWDRATESAIHHVFLDKNNSSAPDEITLDIATELGVTWTEIDSPSGPTEKWYTTTLYYNFKIVIGDTTYIPNSGAKAQFTVRDAGPSGSYAHHWQLVEMRDLGGPSLVSATATATQPSTWGTVKAMFRK